MLVSSSAPCWVPSMAEMLAAMMVDAMAMTKAYQLVVTMAERLDIGSADD